MPSETYGDIVVPSYKVMLAQSPESTTAAAYAAPGQEVKRITLRADGTYRFRWLVLTVALNGGYPNRVFSQIYRNGAVWGDVKAGDLDQAAPQAFEDISGGWKSGDYASVYSWESANGTGISTQVSNFQVWGEYAKYAITPPSGEIVYKDAQQGV